MRLQGNIGSRKRMLSIDMGLIPVGNIVYYKINLRLTKKYIIQYIINVTIKAQ